MGIPLPLGESVVGAWIWRRYAIYVAIIPGGLVAVSSLKRFMEREYSFCKRQKPKREGRVVTWLDFVGIRLVLVLIVAH